MAFIISLIILSSILSISGLNFENAFKLSILTIMNTVNSSMTGLKDFNFEELHYITKYCLILFMINTAFVYNLSFFCSTLFPKFRFVFAKHIIFFARNIGRYRIQKIIYPYIIDVILLKVFCNLRTYISSTTRN